MIAVRVELANGEPAGCVVHAGADGVVTVAYYRLEFTRAFLVEVRVFRSGSFRGTKQAAEQLLKAWEPVDGLEHINATQARSGPLGQMTAEILALAEVPDGPESEWVPLLEVEQAEQIAARANPRSFGFRNVRDLRAHLMYVVTAGYYTHQRAGYVSDLASKIRVSPTEATALLARARSHGYLSSAGGGRRGGVVTDKWFALAERAHMWLEQSREESS